MSESERNARQPAAIGRRSARSRHDHPVKPVIAPVFEGIIASLSTAPLFMMRDKGRTRNTVRALALRVGLAVAPFAFILVASRMGRIRSSGVPVQARWSRPLFEALPDRRSDLLFSLPTRNPNVRCGGFDGK